MKMISSAKRTSKGQTPTCGVKNGENLWNFSIPPRLMQAEYGFSKGFLAVFPCVGVLWVRLVAERFLFDTDGRRFVEMKADGRGHSSQSHERDGFQDVRVWQVEIGG